MIQEKIIEQILDINGYQKLNPPQKESTKYLCCSENILVCSPTASGKTTIFEMYLLDYIINKQKKVIYISPLKALTNEHYRETKRKFSKKYNIKIGMSTGDLDSSSKNLQNYDVLFLTYEKFDSIVRHDPQWLKDIGLVTIDEIHELGSQRGSTLEILITQLRQNYVNISFLGLSATIGNSQEMANWLDAKLIKSNYRPIPLDIGVFFENKLYLENEVINMDHSLDNKKLTKIKDNGLGNILVDTIKKNKQIIVFCNSRKNTMSFSKKYSQIIKSLIIENKNLEKISKEVLNALEQPTKQCLLLYNSIKSGVAFHHAGLIYKQRQLIEDSFKNKDIKIIFATPTLAAGINLPAFRVVINTVYRFTDQGMKPIPVNEFHQMTGRAGRPQYDDKGEAIAIVNKEKDVAKIYNSYVICEPQPIESQLSKIPLLRQHLLSIIMINDIHNKKEVEDFISKTFYYHTFGNNSEIQETTQEIIDEFLEFDFLKGDEDNFTITKIGEKVCLLYLDPISAHNILEAIKKYENKSIFTKLFMITNTSELYPYLRYKIKEENKLFDIFENYKENMYFDYEDLNLLKKIQLTRLLKDWIEETKENDIIEKYNTTPGQIQKTVNKSLWILHCIIQLSKFHKTNINDYKEFKDLQNRLKYGINEELVKLVELKNIGRVRARKLYVNNIKSINDIKKDPDKFLSIIGNIGTYVLEELKIDYEDKKDTENKKNKNKEINKDNNKEDYKIKEKRKIQKNLFDF